MEDKSTRELLTQVSLIKAMLESHVADSNYYRKRVDNHLTYHPTTQKLWGVVIGVGWMVTLGVSVLAVAG
jgi:hypothetical protein